MMRTYLFFAASSMVAITNAIDLEQVQNTYEADNLSQLFAQLDDATKMDVMISKAERTANEIEGLAEFEDGTEPSVEFSNECSDACKAAHNQAMELEKEIRTRKDMLKKIESVYDRLTTSTGLPMCKKFVFGSAGLKRDEESVEGKQSPAATFKEPVIDAVKGQVAAEDKKKA